MFISFKIDACPSVLGTPSNNEPFWQSGIDNLALIRDPIISSETNAPESKISLTLAPSSLPDATASLSISPVLIFGISNKLQIKSACVPLPAPGGPNKIIFFIFLI